MRSEAEGLLHSAIADLEVASTAPQGSGRQRPPSHGCGGCAAHSLMWSRCWPRCPGAAALPLMARRLIPRLFFAVSTFGRGLALFAKSHCPATGLPILQCACTGGMIVAPKATSPSPPPCSSAAVAGPSISSCLAVPVGLIRPSVGLPISSAGASSPSLLSGVALVAAPGPSAIGGCLSRARCRRPGLLPAACRTGMRLADQHQG